MSLRGPGTKVSEEPEGEVYRGGAPFRPAWWLRGSHAQTVWGPVARARRAVRFAREVLATPDGDELVVDWVEGPAASPVLVVLHGLEGSSRSAYVQGLARLAWARGWRAAVMNFRSCARDPDRPGRWIPNRRPRLYHSGETGDLDFLLRVIAARDPGAALVAAGVSLGGNVLVKWLGENPGQDVVRGAAAVSTPYDLAAGARHLETGLGRFYAAGLLATLRAKVRHTAGRFPEAASRMDVPRALSARTFWEFDEAATAPLHGFAGADDYYARSSSLSFLPRVKTPTLCLSASDDPFLPSEVLERARRAASPSVRLTVLEAGGHAGFVAGPAPWRARYWAEESVVAWLAQAAGA